MANAQLIRTAPELYETLAAIRRIAMQYGDGSSPDAVALARIYDAATVPLAKARGE